MQEAVIMQNCTQISVSGPQCTAYLAVAGAGSWRRRVEHRWANLLNLHGQHQHASGTDWEKIQAYAEGSRFGLAACWTYNQDCMFSSLALKTTQQSQEVLPLHDLQLYTCIVSSRKPSSSAPQPLCTAIHLLGLDLAVAETEASGHGLF